MRLPTTALGLPRDLEYASFAIVSGINAHKSRPILDGLGNLRRELARALAEQMITDCLSPAYSLLLAEAAKLIEAAHFGCRT